MNERTNEPGAFYQHADKFLRTTGLSEINRTYLRDSARTWLVTCAGRRFSFDRFMENEMTGGEARWSDSRTHQQAQNSQKCSHLLSARAQQRVHASVSHWGALLSFHNASSVDPLTSCFSLALLSIPQTLEEEPLDHRGLYLIDSGYQQPACSPTAFGVVRTLCSLCAARAAGDAVARPGRVHEHDVDRERVEDERGDEGDDDDRRALGEAAVHA